MDTTPVWLRYAMPRFTSLDHDMDVDVVVVGAGLTGITTAYLLREAGASVVLLERGHCASGDTSHTTAHLTCVTDYRLHKLVKAFGRIRTRAFWEAGAAAIDEISRIARKEDADCDFKWVPAYLHAPRGVPPGKEKDSLQKDATLAASLGFDARFMAKVPGVDRPGVEFRNQARFHPLKYLAALLRSFAAAGGHVFEESEATDVSGNPPTVSVGRRRIKCRFVVIATHSPITGKTPLVRATLFQTKLHLYTSYVLGAEVPAGSLPEALYWDTGNPYTYIRVDRGTPRDYLIFGGEDTKTGQGDDAAAFQRLGDNLRRAFPEATVRHRWLGQVVETSDGLPFIGCISENQFVITGFGGNGFTLGTVGALMARDRFLGRQNPWLDLFDTARKKLRGGFARYFAENKDYPYYFLRDRIVRDQDAQTLAGIPPGEGATLTHRGKRMAVFRRPDGRTTRLSPLCTHLGCVVRWNSADKTWDCPCHGSRFHADGAVLSGPAEDPLKRIR